MYLPHLPTCVMGEKKYAGFETATFPHLFLSGFSPFEIREKRYFSLFGSAKKGQSKIWGEFRGHFLVRNHAAFSLIPPPLTFFIFCSRGKEKASEPRSLRRKKQGGRRERGLFTFFKTLCLSTLRYTAKDVAVGGCSGKASFLIRENKKFLAFPLSLSRKKKLLNGKQASRIWFRFWRKGNFERHWCDCAKKKIHSSHASISYERERETDLLSLLLLLFLLSIPPPAIPHNPSCKKEGKDGWREREREREKEREKNLCSSLVGWVGLSGSYQEWDLTIIE